MKRGIVFVATSSAEVFAKKVFSIIKANKPPKFNFSDNCDIAFIKTNATKFSNGETTIDIQQSVRDKDVFVFQSTTLDPNSDAMELLLTLDALKRAGSYRVTTVASNYLFARQDRKSKSRCPISARLIADLITVAGSNRLLTAELHSPQIAGFFNFPVDNLYSGPVFIEHIKENNTENNICIVAPDAGSIKRAKSYARSLDCDVVMLYKHREVVNEVAEMHLIGEVEGKNCIIIDDMADTMNTCVKAAAIIKERGAKTVTAYVTHAILSGKAIENLANSAISKLYVTDTVDNPRVCKSRKIEVISVAPLFAEAIINIHSGKSLSCLFNPEG